MGVWDAIDRQLEKAAVLATPATVAAYLDAATVETPMLERVTQALLDLMDTPGGRLIITTPPQEGKSTRVVRDFVSWVVSNNPDKRVITASYGQELADRNGENIRGALLRLAPITGVTVDRSTSAKDRFKIDGRKGQVLSVSTRGGVTGQSGDLLVIDDPIRGRKDADSKTEREAVWGWFRTDALTRIKPRDQVVIILTRWHEDDLAGRILAGEDADRWQVLNIPAQAVENDPLGRKPGEWLVSATGKTPEEWEAVKKSMGPRAWSSLYQGNPTPAAGNQFQRDWVKRYTVIPAEPPLAIVQSWDLAFGANGDWVVGQVWEGRPSGFYLIDQVRARLDFPATVAAFTAMSERHPAAVAKLVEAKANGQALIDTLRQQGVMGIIPIIPTLSKEQRADLVTPLFRAGNVHIPTGAWGDEFVEELVSFPNAAHDDQVDAAVQALRHMTAPPARKGWSSGFSNLG